MNVSAASSANPSSEGSLSDSDWDDILSAIKRRKVIPVIGPELVTLPDPATGEIIPLCQFLAPRLAAALSLPEAQRFTKVNSVACQYLLTGGSRAKIYNELRKILDHLDSPPCAALIDLARITDFDLIISSVFDHQLSHALKAVRPDFEPSEPDLTRKHLAEAQQLAERGPMPLYLADIHLHRARLFHDPAALAQAAHLIPTLGYGLRTAELTAAQAAALHWLP